MSSHMTAENLLVTVSCNAISNPVSELTKS